MTSTGLQAMATPEMVSYFADQLSQQVSRGVRNTVTDVRLERATCRRPGPSRAGTMRRWRCGSR